MRKARQAIVMIVITVLAVIGIGVGVVYGQGTSRLVTRLTSVEPSVATVHPLQQSCTHPPLTAYVLVVGTGVAAINVATNTAKGTIQAGQTPDAVALTPDGSAVYVTSNQVPGIVTPINACADKPGRAIRVGRQPSGVVVAPDGKTVYALNAGSNTVTPIAVGTARALRPIPALVGTQGTLDPAVVTPNGKTLYVTFDVEGYSLVTPINTATNKAEKPIKDSGVPYEMAFSPNGNILYVMSQDWLGNQELGGVMVIDTRTNTVVANISVGTYPYAMVLTPNGKTIYVANGNSGSVSAISTSINRVVATILVGELPQALAIDPKGRFVYVVNEDSNSLSQIEVATNAVTKTIQVFDQPGEIAITPDGSTAYVDGGDNDNIVVPISLKTFHVGKAIPVGSAASEIMIGP